MSNPSKKQENPWLSIAFNIAIPSLILMKLSGPELLGAEVGFASALLFPFSYAIFDFVRRRTFNFIAALGFTGILVKGGLGFLKLNTFWFAVNEAAIPLLLAIILWVSILMRRPLIGLFLLNDSVMHVDKIQSAVKEKNREPEYESSIREATYLLVLSFLVSAALNFGLAIYMLKSPVGTEAFNEEMGVMTAVSMPVILVCSMSIMVVALWRLLRKLHLMTGLEYEAMFRGQEKR